MGILYAGTMEFFEEAEAEENIDEFGLNEVIRKIGGPRSIYAAYRRTLADATPDPEFDTLRLVLRRTRVQHDGPFSHITLSFKGLLGEEPKPRRSQGLIEKNVTLTSPDGSSLTLTYMAPFATFRYATLRRPRFPRYKGQVLKLAGANIIDMEGSFASEIEEGEEPSVGVSPNSLANWNGTDDPRFIFRWEVTQTTFDAEEEGSAWQVTETNEMRIVDARRTFPDDFRLIQGGVV